MQRQVDPNENICSEVISTEFCATDNPHYFMLLQNSLSGSRETVSTFLNDLKTIQKEYDRTFTARQSPYPSMVGCSLTIAIFLYYLAMHERTPWKFLLVAGVIMGLCYDLYSKPGKHTRALAVRDALRDMRQAMHISNDLPVTVSETEEASITKQTKHRGLTVVRTLFKDNWLAGRDPQEIAAQQDKLVLATIRRHFRF